MKKPAAEFFGTFVLVFAGTGAIVINEVSGGAVTHAGIALTFGLIVLAMIYTVGDVSGAHLNPAVTIGFFAPGRFTAGIAIGSVIGLEAMFAGPICGVSMNPARSFAPALVSMHFQSLWIYLIAPVCGALLGVPICRLIRDDQCCRVRFLEREFRGQIENEEM